MAADTPKQDAGVAPPTRGEGAHELDLAAVDLGSNSFHMLVARIGSDGLTSDMVSGMERDLNPDFKLIAVQTYEVALPWWAIGD